MYMLTMILQEDGLTFMDVVSDIPHDAPAILVYILLAVCAYGLWWGNRHSGKKVGTTLQTASGSGDQAEPSGTLDSGLRTDAADGSSGDVPPQRGA